MSLSIRRMNREDLGLALEWAESEGWGPGLGDGDAFFAADPNGYWALDLDGEMVASLSAVGYPGGVHFMGFYIVRPDHRGSGLGLRLWDEVWERLDGLVLAGDAVPEQVANYERDGFEVAHRNLRFSGMPAQRESAGTRLADASAVDFDALVEFDGRHSFGARPEFLRHWIAGPGRRAIVALGDDGAIRGFGVVRPSNGPHRIGPLYAFDDEVASDLIIELARDLAGPIALDVPLPNGLGVAMVEALGLEPGFETLRIYRGQDPGLPLDRIFAITSLELG